MAPDHGIENHAGPVAVARGPAVKAHHMETAALEVYNSPPRGFRKPRAAAQPAGPCVADSVRGQQDEVRPRKVFSGQLIHPSTRPVAAQTMSNAEPFCPDLLIL